MQHVQRPDCFLTFLADMDNPILWYVADPMCSWCWGFAPVIEKIRKEYSAFLTMQLMLGGLRPGTKAPLSPDKRAQILHHWQAVHATTGQPFKFDNALQDNLIYDTEPASRAVVSIAIIEPTLVFPFFASIQRAFYVEQADVTQLNVLKKLAVDLNVSESQFIQIFESDTAKQQTLNNFRRAAQWGISGFPTLIIESGSDYHLITMGFRPIEALRPQLDTWLRHNRSL